MRIKALIQALTGTSHIICESIETESLEKKLAEDIKATRYA